MCGNYLVFVARVDPLASTLPCGGVALAAPAPTANAATGQHSRAFAHIEAAFPSRDGAVASGAGLWAGVDAALVTDLEAQARSVLRQQVSVLGHSLDSDADVDLTLIVQVGGTVVVRV